MLVRTHRRGFVFTDGLTDLSDREVAAHVARGQAFFAGHGESVEWKAYGHDHPALASALAGAGFVAEPTETVLVARSADLVDSSTSPTGLAVRLVVGREDFTRIAEMETQVWGEDWSWLAEDLADRQASDPSAISVYVAEAAGAVVSAGWLVVLPGTSFAGL